VEHPVSPDFCPNGYDPNPETIYEKSPDESEGGSEWNFHF
jgi:hypothetical protein